MVSFVVVKSAFFLKEVENRRESGVIYSFVRRLSVVLLEEEVVVVTGATTVESGDGSPLGGVEREEGPKGVGGSGDDVCLLSAVSRAASLREDGDEEGGLGREELGRVEEGCDEGAGDAEEELGELGQDDGGVDEEGEEVLERFEEGSDEEGGAVDEIVGLGREVDEHGHQAEGQDDDARRGGLGVEDPGNLTRLDRVGRLPPGHERRQHGPRHRGVRRRVPRPPGGGAPPPL
mmetsp:Transcript_32721/g.104304  ORF Transcript_32721/g.104304 Transcript_32721/m.104304 type:complete len:233 (+) Transcript_32721:540-1238(+)